MSDKLFLEKMFVLHTVDNRIEVSLSIGYRFLSVATDHGLLTQEECTQINEHLNKACKILNDATERVRRMSTISDLEKDGIVKVQS